RLAVSSDVGTPWTLRRPLRIRSPRALTKDWDARPEPSPIREAFGTNSRALSTIVMGDLLRARLFLAKSLAEFLLLILGQVGTDDLELQVLQRIGHAVQDGVARHQEECGCPFRHLAANPIDEIRIDAIVPERPSQGTDGRADGHPKEGHEEYPAKE